MKHKITEFFEITAKTSIWHKVIIYFCLLMILSFTVLYYYSSQVVFTKNAIEKINSKTSAFQILQVHEETEMEKKAHTIATFLAKQQSMDFEAAKELLDDQVEKKVFTDNIEMFYLPSDALTNPRYSVAVSDSSVLSQALEARKAVQGIEIWDAENLKKLGIAENPRVTLFSGANTFPLTKSVEETALMNVVADPIFRDNKYVGTVVVTKMYNKEGEVLSLAERQLKAAAVFTLGDEIIAAKSSINHKKLLGSKLPQDVVIRLLDKEKNYYGETKLNNTNVYVGFSPLRDNNKKVIGACGVIVPASTFKPLLDYLLVRFSFLIFLCLLLGGFGIFWFAQEINKPLSELLMAAKEMAAGNFPQAIALEGKSNGEMIQLLQSFNGMVESLHQRKIEGEQIARDVEEKNMELVAQQEELQAQQEELLSLNQEMAAIIEELDSTQNIIFTLALAVEAKDVYTKGHSERVAKYAELMAKAMHLPEKEVINIKNASLLHDIGKIGINDGVLNKPDKLSAEEFAMVQEHPLIGERICAPLRSCSSILSLIRHHHEWYNGSGYPDGLKGEEIPLGARIMSVADAFDAMTTNRPYRKGMSAERAIHNLKSGEERQWDANIVDVFIELHDNNQLP